MLEAPSVTFNFLHFWFFLAGLFFWGELLSPCETSEAQRVAFDRTQPRGGRYAGDYVTGWQDEAQNTANAAIGRFFFFNICTFVSLTYDVLRLKRVVGGVFRSSARYERSGDYNCFPNCLFEQQPSQLVLGLCFLQYHCPTLAACLYEFFKPALAFNYICIYKVSASVIS